MRKLLISLGFCLVAACSHAHKNSQTSDSSGAVSKILAELSHTEAEKWTLKLSKESDQGTERIFSDLTCFNREGTQLVKCVTRAAVMEIPVDFAGSRVEKLQFNAGADHLDLHGSHMMVCEVTAPQLVSCIER